MTKLLDLARLLLPPYYDKRSDVENSEVEQRFVEELTFASSDEIVAMLRTGLDENWIGLPVWARNLAFRLACLQRPQDVLRMRRCAEKQRQISSASDQTGTRWRMHSNGKQMHWKEEATFQPAVEPLAQRCMRTTSVISRRCRPEHHVVRCPVIALVQ